MHIKYFTPFLIGLIIAILNSSCQSGELDLGDDFISSQTYTALIDTVTVQFSTIKADSIATSGGGVGLIGYHQHPILGGQESKSYFSMNMPSTFSWDEEEQIFDSLTLVINPTGYFIGDTLTKSLYNIHRLSEKIDFHDDGKLYNTSAFNYSAETLGSSTISSYPYQKEKVEIRLNDTYANEIIDFMLEYKNHQDKSTLFKDQFKGIVINCDTNLTRATYSYALGDTSSYICLYSHKINLEKEEIATKFPLSAASHFNQIASINKQVKFNQIPDGKTLLNEQKTNNKVLIQSGTGFKTRIDFPGLKSLLELKAKGHFVKAELRLYPDMDFIKTKDLLNTIYISDIYRANDIWGLVTDASGNALTSALKVDNMYHESTYYSFDLTNYLNTRLYEEVIDTDRGLVISFADSDTGKSLNWLAFNGHYSSDRPSQLILYYYFYDTE